jgi:hypothetical protein
MHLLTTASAWVGLLTMAGALWVAAANPACDHELPRGLSQPGLAIELAKSRQDVQQILGEPAPRVESLPASGGPSQNEMERQANLCPQARKKLAAMQERDFLFIPLYVGFLTLIGGQVMIGAGLAARLTKLARLLLGGGAVGLAVTAGAFDLLEDGIILECLRNIASCSIVPRPWALGKWAAIFAVFLLNIPAFLQRRDVTGTARLLAYIAAVLSAFAAVSGLVALSLSDDPRLEDTTGSLAAAMLASWLAMAGFAWFPSGLGSGLDRLAALPGLRWLSEWPSDEEEEGEQSTQPSAHGR